MTPLNAYPQRSPADQADGLRRLFAGSRQRIVPLVTNPFVPHASVLLERLSSALAELGATTLVVDAADTSPEASEMAEIDLPGCVEALGSRVHYLAARGLPLRHVNARGSSEAWLAAVQSAAPRADAIVLHANARDLVRLLGRRALRPVLMASVDGPGLTDAYTSMKLLAQRSGLLTFDLLIDLQDGPRRALRMAERLAQTGDTFLGSVLRTFAGVDCSRPLDAPLEPALIRLATEQLLNDDAGLPVPRAAQAPLRTTAAPLLY